MLRRWMLSIVPLMVAGVLAGCGSGAATLPTTPTPTRVFHPSFTLSQMDTPTPTPQPPTRTPRPSPTVTPTPPPLPTIAPEFWATVGVAPDTLVALQSGSLAHAQGDIAVMSIDGTHYQQLTTYGYNRDPRLSPDRQRVAYLSVPASIVSSPDREKRLKEGNFNVWVISVDGAQAWKLTDSEEPRSAPDWSADSRKVLFSEGTEGALVEIEVDTQSRREITRGAYAPRYRPGGGVGYLTEGSGLAWIDDAGVNHALVLTTNLPLSTTVSEFVWLPDGRRIAYILLDRSNVQKFPWVETSSVEVVNTEDGIVTHLIGPLVNKRLSAMKVSPAARFLSAIGNSYGDACAAGSSSEFWLMSSTFAVVDYVSIQGFDGSLSKPFSDTGIMFPRSPVIWISGDLAIGRFGATCIPESYSVFGWYLVDFDGKRMMQIMRD